MKFGYTIIYVADVPASMAFWERAFGLQRRFIDATGVYGELEAGATCIAFASHGLMADLLPPECVTEPPSPQHHAFEIGLFTEDVPAAYAKALAQGATGLTPPRTTPWGQTVSFVRCPEGTLVELCTAIKR